MFPELEEGYTLKIRFSSESFTNKDGQTSKPYAKAARIDFNERTDVYDESILAEVPNLQDLLILLPYKEIENILFDVDEEDKAGDNEQLADEPQETSTRTTKPNRTRKPKDEKPEKEKDEVSEELEKVVLQEGQKHCIACGGTGKSSNGRKCHPCKGTGIVQEKEKEEENLCPHGHTFGADCDKHPDNCDTCTNWDACMEEQEKG